MDLDITTRYCERWAVLHVAGELDIATRDKLSRRLTPMLADYRGAGIIVDLSDLSFCDASGLRVLFDAGQAARRHGRHLRLAIPGGQVRLVARVTELDKALPVFPTVHAAITGTSAITASGPPSTPTRAGRVEADSAFRT